MRNPIRSEISIIGAGPAGLTAALCLAGRGIDCLLIDKAGQPREKVCGDGLGGKVLSILRRINPAFVTELTGSGFAAHSHAVRFFSPSLRMLELEFRSAIPGTPAGLVCKRADFDRFLLEKAVNSVNIHFVGNVKIGSITRNKGKLQIHDDSGKEIAGSNLVLLATGWENKLAMQLDPFYVNSGQAGLGVRGYFENVTGCDEKNAIEIHFLRELLPWYLWIFPLPGGLTNVGLAMPISGLRENPASLKQTLFSLIDRYPHLARRFQNAKLHGKLGAARIPVFTGSKIISGDNYMILGDTATLVDPFTGEGIGNAMASGEYAAAAAAHCHENGDFSARSTQLYHEKINTALFPDLANGLKLHRLARNRFLLDLVIGKASLNESLRNEIAEMIYNSGNKRKLERISFYIKLMLGL